MPHRASQACPALLADAGGCRPAQCSVLNRASPDLLPWQTPARPGAASPHPHPHQAGQNQVPDDFHASLWESPDGCRPDFFPDFCIIFAACCLAAATTSATVLFRKRDAVRLLRIEEKLDLILKRADLAYTPLHDLPEDALEALRQGNDLAAVRFCTTRRREGPGRSKKIR